MSVPGINAHSHGLGIITCIINLGPKVGVDLVVESILCFYISIDIE